MLAGLRSQKPVVGSMHVTRDIYARDAHVVFCAHHVVPKHGADCSSSHNLIQCRLMLHLNVTHPKQASKV